MSSLLDVQTLRWPRSGMASRSTAGMEQALAFGLAMILAVLPLLATETPPFFDYPNHLSRAHVLAEFASSKTFQAWFAPAGFLIPNVSADLILAGLMQIVRPELAGRLLLLAIAMLTLGGAVALGRAASGRFAPWPLLAGLLVFNEMLQWGFLNYALGVAELLWGLAAWIAFGRRSRGLQLGAGAAFALAIFFSHLVAFGLYAVTVAALEIADLRWPRGGEIDREIGRRAVIERLATSALVFLPPATLFVLISPSSSLPAAPRFNITLFEKLAPYTRLLSSGNPVFDGLVLVGAAALVAGFAFAGRLGIDRRLALAAAGMAACQLVLPYSALNSFFVDSRIAVVVVLVLLCALTARRPDLRSTRLALVAILGLSIVRAAVLTQSWSATDKAYAEIVAGLDRLPQGSVLIAATRAHFEYGTGWFYTRRVNPPHEHTASYATIRRDAIVPAIFAKAGQNPLIFTPPSKTIRAMALGPIPRVFSSIGLRRLARRASAAAGEIQISGHSRQNVYIIAFYVTCKDWPAGLPLRPTVCGSTFSVMQAVRPAAAKDAGGSAKSPSSRSGRRRPGAERSADRS